MLTALQERAGAADAGGAIVGRLQSDEAPVAGVEIVVRRGDQVVGRDRSGAAGEFRIPVDGPGEYRVAIDPATIPPGFRLQDRGRLVLPKVVVQPTQDKFVLFPFGRGSALDPPSMLERVTSVTVSGVKLGLIIGLAAVGLTMVFATTGLVNFAHGELVTFGALVAWYLNAGGVPLVAAGVLAAVGGGLLGAGLELALWRPLRRRRAGATAAMIISTGVALLLRNAYLLVFEGPARTFHQFAVQSPWSVGPFLVLPKNVVIMGAAGAVLAALAMVLSRSRPGIAVRAVADEHDLAEASGVDVDRVVLTVWIGSASLAALAGVALGATESVQWDMGLRLLLVMFAAIVVGGLGSVSGAVLGGLLVGLASEMSTLFIPNEFKIVVALGTLILVLLARPQGILGKAVRVG